MVHDSSVAAIGRTLALIGGALVATLALAALYVGVVWMRLPSVDSAGDTGDPGRTPFQRADRCESIDVRYRPLDAIDPRLGCAVVIAEDINFFHHDGVDWAALRAAVRDSWRAGRPVRGASTIPMQLARNLWLDRGRHPSRKLRELLLAPRLVDRYDRRRLLELYLNVAELGPCVYGAEAGAQHYFGHGADRLDLAEATFLAAMLPRPRTPPGSVRGDRIRVQGRQRQLVDAFWKLGLVPSAQTRAAARELVQFWHQGWTGHEPVAAAPGDQEWYARGCGTGRNP